MAQIIDGKKVSAQTREEIKKNISAFKQKTGITPGLATVLVGNDPASHVYVSNKIKACSEVGIFSAHLPLPETATETELLALVEKLNNDEKIHGILVQLPLPKHLNASKILQTILPEKDVDGFHPVNVGKLVMGEPCLKACTPYGVIKLLESTGVDLSGKHAVVLGRSQTVGKPMALLLLEKNATVTVCHSKTKNIPEIVKTADIVVAALGKPQFVKGEWVKEGAIVIDVGINRLPNGKLAGDVDFESVSQKASFITPVPGGVGPMTITMLLYNTLEAAKK